MAKRNLLRSEPHEVMEFEFGTRRNDGKVEVGENANGSCNGEIKGDAPIPIAEYFKRMKVVDWEENNVEEAINLADEEHKDFLQMGGNGVDDSSMDSNDPEYNDWHMSGKYAIDREMYDREKLCEITEDCTPRTTTMIKEFVKCLKEENIALEDKLTSMRAMIEEKDDVISILTRQLGQLETEIVHLRAQRSVEHGLMVASSVGSMLGVVVAKKLSAVKGE